MRYRRLSPAGDYVFGHGILDFLVNSPAAVGQAVLTRLRLFQGEFFLDTSKGMPWNTEVLGTDTQSLFDQAIKNYVLETEGVTKIFSYSSSIAIATRSLSITMNLGTIYSGNTLVQTRFSITGTASGFGYGLGPYGNQPYGGTYMPAPEINLSSTSYGLIPYDEGSIT